MSCMVSVDIIFQKSDNPVFFDVLKHLTECGWSIEPFDGCTRYYDAAEDDWKTEKSDPESIITLLKSFYENKQKVELSIGRIDESNEMICGQLAIYDPADPFHISFFMDTPNTEHQKVGE